ncbi:ANL43 [Synechococcus elongatus]|uniref:ANL43 n=1 Tax=Synechococcus elongatus (strain ATCC 33912 / PCC 7942 / FACHB-805) TaxID=1140 RepID=Q8KUU3_SYNE7|nr:ANL43 [Synechococcus elongatus]AAM81168.2 ANL43 [Synechococcus elongatus PCC 7942 = FACHB-805]ABB58646.1 conserved hypothetical protein [Synechococcus elongatus PCC 7942 = FACHB-805]AJD58971.1 hypothetical protein M744_14050 [Synechococcus elongatus UTEX 2973]MBD2589070.1 hypothetical protein [Synechococcus elongatus FACHB-242]MBD2690109.1 hypothetical protein [Synechococcus elongatus FACHB-1061]
MAVLKNLNGQLISDSDRINSLLQIWRSHLYSIRDRFHGTILSDTTKLDRWRSSTGLEVTTWGQRLLQDLNLWSEDAWCEPLTIRPGSPRLLSFWEQQHHYHFHSGPEIIAILRGNCTYSLEVAQGSVLEIWLEPGDVLQIGNFLPHQLSLGPLLELQAMRYFSSQDGWISHQKSSIPQPHP